MTTKTASAEKIQKRIAATGNEAAAMAMRQIHPNVVAAYPITPQTEIVQIFSTFVSDGLVDTEFVPVESEHSAMSATIAASAAGARAMTATSANGLALMWEMLYIAAGTRLPIVMPLVNRALSAPINIHCDHSDAMGARDAGWIQLFSENAQEMYDNMIQAIRIAEHPDVMLPVMVNMDGFITSHGMEILKVLDDEVVTNFVGEYKAKNPLLDVDNPITVGPLALQDYYFEFKRQQSDAMEKAKAVIEQTGKEYGDLTGRYYGYFEEYRLEDAEIGLVVMNSAAGTAKDVVDELRGQGVKIGLLKPRVFRPFPAEELCNALKGLKAVGIMDRADSFSTQGGPLAAETKAALYQADQRPLAVSFVYGLGGRDTGVAEIKFVAEKVQQAAQTGVVEQSLYYVGVRE
jgi:pyruvate ferredoxin oxidoreductase alpha subunit